MMLSALTEFASKSEHSSVTVYWLWETLWIVVPHEHVIHHMTSCDTMMTSHDIMWYNDDITWHAIQWWHHMTPHDIMIEDHSQDWWDRATKCFLNLQESVVQRSGQDRHPVRAGGERSGRRGPLITRHQPMNSTCTSTKRTQWLYYILSAYCFELGRARPCTYPVFTGIKSYPVVRKHFHYRIAARWGWEGGRKGRENFHKLTVHNS